MNQITHRHPVTAQVNKAGDAWRFIIRWSIVKTHPLHRKYKKEKRCGEEASSFCFATKMDALTAADHAHDLIEANWQMKYQNRQDRQAEGHAKVTQFFCSLFRLVRCHCFRYFYLLRILHVNNTK